MFLAQYLIHGLFVTCTATQVVIVLAGLASLVS